MDKKEYIQSLKDPRWQRKRLEILQRDNFTCQACKCGEETLHVHHKKYIEGLLPWEYEDKDLITLCEYCHIIIPIFERFFKHNFRPKTDVITSIWFTEKYTTFHILIKRKVSHLYILTIAKDRGYNGSFRLRFSHKINIDAINYYLKHNKFQPYE